MMTPLQDCGKFHPSTLRCVDCEIEFIERLSESDRQKRMDVLLEVRPHDEEDAEWLQACTMIGTAQIIRRNERQSRPIFIRRTCISYIETDFPRLSNLAKEMGYLVFRTGNPYITHTIVCSESDFWTLVELLKKE